MMIVDSIVYPSRRRILSRSILCTIVVVLDRREGEKGHASVGTAGHPHGRLGDADWPARLGTWEDRLQIISWCVR